MFLTYEDFKNAVIKANLLKEEDFYIIKNRIFSKAYNFSYNSIILGKLKNMNLSYCEAILFKCCLCKRLDIIKFLIENDQQKIYEKINYKKIAFKLSCFEGFTNIVKYLYEVFDIKNEKINIIKIFNKVCENNKLSTAKWLYKTFNIDIANCYDLFYRICVEYFYIQIAKWLYKVGKFDLIKEVGIFRYFMKEKSCTRFHPRSYKIISWLVSLNDNYILVSKKDLFNHNLINTYIDFKYSFNSFFHDKKIIPVIKLLKMKLI